MRIKDRKGFALIILAVILAVAGVLIIALLTPAPSKELQDTVKTKNKKIDKIHDALVVYYKLNNAFPMPASLTATPANAGANYLKKAPVTVCNGVAAINFPNTDGCMAVVGQKVMIGVVPTRDLGLPDDYAVDEWGNRLWYVVDMQGKNNISLTNAAGTALPIIDINGEDSDDGVVSVLIISAGKNGKGAYTKNGVVNSAACPVSVTETENCNGDTAFIKDNKSTNFDDLVSYLALPTPCPAKISNCVFYIKASEAKYPNGTYNDNDKAPVWYDKSTYGYNMINFTYSYDNSNLTSSPTYKLSEPTLNNKPVISITSAQSLLGPFIPVFQVGQPSHTTWTFIYLGRTNGASKHVMLVSDDYGPAWYLGNWGGGFQPYNKKNVAYFGGWITADPSTGVGDDADSNWNIYSGVADGVNGTFYSNGANKGTAAHVDAPHGAHFNMTSIPWATSDMQIAEVVAYPTPLTDVQRRRIECYMAHTYNSADPTNNLCTSLPTNHCDGVGGKVSYCGGTP